MFSRHVIIILFINALSVLVKASYVSINAFGGADQILGDFTYGELGRLKPVISPEEKELEDICNCLQGNGYCIHKLQNYGPIVRQGTCYGNLSTRNKRKAKRSDVAFSSPPTFIENKKCRGTKTIILASSGMERQLTLTTPASVFICNGSIEASLQQLFITGVNKIVIAPGALKHRVTDLEIRFSSLEDKIIIPEEGLAIQITVDDQSMDNPGIEIDQTPLLPPKIRLEVDTANDIEFRSRSLVAPIVHLKLNQVKKVSFDSNSIIPYAYPEASTLEIGHCHSVTMDTQTINTGKYEAKNIKHLFMKEKAVEVVGKDGSVAKIEYVSNITLLDEALSIGSGADILLNNLTFTSAGVRAIQGNGPGYLRRAAFTYVAGKQFESVAMCIKAETAVVYNVEIRGNNDSIVGACIEGQVIHKDDKPGETVGCLKVEGSPLLCNNSACAPCGPEPNGDLTEEPVSIITTIQAYSTTAAVEFATLNFLNATTEEITSGINVTYTENYTDPYLQEIPFYTPLYTGSNDFIGEKKQPTILIPIYVIIICVVGALILTIFIVYMVYRCATRNRHFKYYLPRENRLTTFHNPRTIMTAENLRSQANTIQSNHETRTQLYTTYDAYRQPCVAYVPAAEPIAIAITHQGEDLASNSPPPSYEPVDSHSQGYNIHESYYGNTDEQLSLRTPYREDDVTRLPECSEISSHISDDQIQASKISLSSESSSSTEASMPSKTDQTTGTLKSLSEDLQEDYEKCYEKALNDDSYTPDHHYSAKQKQTSCDNPYDIEEAQSVGDEMYI